MIKVMNGDEKIGGPEKAAIFMLSLSQGAATKMFAQLSDPEIKELSHKMAALGVVKSKVVEALYSEFRQRFHKSGSTIVGSLESTERFLSSIFDEKKVKEILAELKGPAGRTMWDKLANVSEELLSNYLQNEHPQTVAVILSKLKPTHAARIFSVLPDDFSIEVMLRMLNIETVDQAVLENLERTLRTEFMTTLSSSAKENPHEHMAEVFNSFDRATEGKLLSSLEQKNTEAADRIRSLMFTFDDLKKIDASGIQTLMRFVDKAKLPLALKGTSQEILDLFFKNMSERAAKLLKEDMESLGAVRLKVVDEAQQSIVILAKELASKGEITIRNPSEEQEELVS